MGDVGFLWVLLLVWLMLCVCVCFFVVFFVLFSSLFFFFFFFWGGGGCGAVVFVGCVFVCACVRLFVHVIIGIIVFCLPCWL